MIREGQRHFHAGKRHVPATWPMAAGWTVKSGPHSGAGLFFASPGVPGQCFSMWMGRLFRKTAGWTTAAFPTRGSEGNGWTFSNASPGPGPYFWPLPCPGKRRLPNAGTYSPIYQEVSLQEARMWSFGQGIIRQEMVIQRKTIQGTTVLISCTPSTPPGSLSSRRFSPTPAPAFTSASMNTKAALISLRSRDRRTAAGRRKR